jgi:hypothetical protein
MTKDTEPTVEGDRPKEDDANGLGLIHKNHIDQILANVLDSVPDQ